MDDRATTAVVGVVVLTALAAVLAAGVGATLFATAQPSATPQAHITGRPLSASDDWPAGQTVRLVHESGESLAVADLTVVLDVDRAGDGGGDDERTVHVRLTGFPTRRLTAKHVAGAAVVDRSYAGIDGALDAVSTDGRWESGETASVRIASGDLDLRPGDTVIVRVVHAPTGGVVARVRLTAR
jgi:FlaG/FlaF family flagellin (archaellin)